MLVYQPDSGSTAASRRKYTHIGASSVDVVTCSSATDSALQIARSIDQDRPHIGSRVPNGDLSSSPGLHVLFQVTSNLVKGSIAWL